MESNNRENVSNELLHFFLLAYVISWVLWILAPIISDIDSLAFFWICLIGAFGPSLSAIIITSIKNPRPSNIPRVKQVKIFVVVFISCLLLGIIFFLPFFEIYLLIIIGSAIAAFIFSGIYSSRQAVVDLLKSLKGVQGKNIFILIAILLPMGAYFVGSLIYLLFGGVYPEDFTWIDLFIGFALSFPFIFFFGGALNEEPGWRGFALPQLQKRFSPLISGLILGVLWSLWHAPLHFNGFYGDGWTSFLIRLIFNPFGIILTWYYNSSKGNLLGCVFFHASINIFVAIIGVFPETEFYSYLIFGAICIVVIIYDKMWKKNIEK